MVLSLVEVENLKQILTPPFFFSHMKNPAVAQKIRTLINAGVLRIG